MRASRLVSILLLLQTRGRMSGQELARELEVSVRTIYRDVESLSTSGVPIYADRGPTGGFQLLDGYRTRLTGMTPQEAESLFLAGIPGPAADLGLGQLLAAAQLKLKAALPEELRERAGRIGERFHLDAPGWWQDEERPPFLTIVADAVWNERMIEIRYQRWGGEVTRKLAPLGIVLKGGAWYLVASAEGQIRTYRTIRILTLESLNETFERPPDFDLASYWQEWGDGFQQRLYQQEAVVRFSPAGIEIVSYLMEPYLERVVLGRVVPSDPDGWFTVVLPVQSNRHALRALLPFGAEIEVLSPPELREMIRENAEALLSHHQRISAESTP
jgi:predicted DNA-binding transcriptional regulator YafY